MLLVLLIFGGIALVIGLPLLIVINRKLKQDAKQRSSEKEDLFKRICPIKAIEELPVTDSGGNMSRWGLIILPNNEYRIIMAIRGVNFYLLNQEEQQSIAKALQRMAFALEYTVQFYTSNQMLDLSRAAQELLDLAGDLTGPLGEYALMQYQYFNDLSRTRRITSRQTYAVLGVSLPDREQAERELYTLVRRFENAIRPVGAQADVLSPEAVVDTLYFIFNRDRVFKPSVAIANGVLSPVKGVEVNVQTPAPAA